MSVLLQPKLSFKINSGINQKLWKKQKFGDIFFVKRGASPRPISDPKWFDKDSNIGWVRISDASKSNKFLLSTSQKISKKGKEKSRFIEKNNLIMSICATIGYPIITGIDVCIHDGFVVFEPKNINIDTHFVYYYLQKIESNWIKFGQPGAQVNLNSNIVSNENVYLPEIKEQKKIATFLSSVDKKIELLTKQHEQLEKYKKGLMQKIFSQEIRFKQDDGSDFPEWEIKYLGEVCDVEKGKQLNKDLLNTTDKYPVINGGIDPSGCTNNYNSDENSICISEGGNSCGYVNFINKKFWAGGHCYVLKKIISFIYKEFLFHYLKHNQKTIMNLRVGSGLPNIQKKEIVKFEVNYPDVNEQQKIASFLSSVDKKIDLVKQKIDKTQTFKKGLLQQMFV